MSKSALDRHGLDHIERSIVATEVEQQVARGNDVLAEAEAVLTKASELLTQAERSGDIRSALQGVREMRGCIDLLARLKAAMGAGSVPVVIVEANDDVTTEEAYRLARIVAEELANWPSLRSRIADRLDREMGRSPLALTHATADGFATEQRQ